MEYRYFSVAINEKDIGIHSGKFSDTHVITCLMEKAEETLLGSIGLFSNVTKSNNKMAFNCMRCVDGYHFILDLAIPAYKAAALNLNIRLALSDDLIPMHKLLGDSKCYCCGHEHTKEEE